MDEWTAELVGGEMKEWVGGSMDRCIDKKMGG